MARAMRAKRAECATDHQGLDLLADLLVRGHGRPGVDLEDHAGAVAVGCAAKRRTGHDRSPTRGQATRARIAAIMAGNHIVQRSTVTSDMASSSEAPALRSSRTLTPAPAMECSDWERMASSAAMTDGSP